nr:MAG TPA: hypothetical protein [Caudoviricetes sp.]
MWRFFCALFLVQTEKRCFFFCVFLSVSEHFCRFADIYIYKKII